MEVFMRAALTNALSASMLAMAVAAVGLILSRRPAILHCLWMIVLVKLLAPPILEVPLTNPRILEPSYEPQAATLMIAFDPTDAREEAAAVASPPSLVEPFEATELIDVAPFEPAEASAPWVDPALAWGALAAVWLAGSMTTAGLAVVRVRRFQRLLRSAEPAEPEVEDEVAALSSRMGLRRPPDVDFIEGRLTPLLWAVGRPRLVIPRALWKSLDDRRRTLLLTHELAHLRRGDHWLRLLELAVTVVYWWLPVAWWVRRALRDVEEQCCDAWVVWMFPDEARTYAETLLDTVDFLNPVAKTEPLLASGFGKVHHLRKRLTMVMLGKTPRSPGWSGTMGALALAGVLLPMSPSWAQKALAPAESADAKAAKSEEVVVSITSDASTPSPAIGKFDADRDGKDDLEDVLMLSNPLGEAITAFAIEVADDEEKSNGDEKAEDAKPGEKKTKEVRILIKGADLPKGGEEAIQKAIEKLNLQIKERAGKDSEEGREIEIQALKAAIEQLKKIAPNIPQMRIGGVPADVKPSEHIIVTDGRDVLTENVKGGVVTLQSGDGKEPNVVIRSQDGRAVITDRIEIDGTGRATSPDGKPTAVDVKQIEEVRKQIAELSKEMAVKQKQLAEAHHRLAELQGWGGKYKVGEVGINAARPAVARSMTVRDVRNSERVDRREEARLDALEKKLSKVLEELDGLKKHKAEGEGEVQKK